MEPKRVPLTGEQFNEMLAAYPDYHYPKEFAGIEFVVGDVRLTPGLKMIPEGVVFDGNMDASRAEFSGFNHVVNGDANFNGCKSLVVFAAKTRFNGSVDARGTGLSVFDEKVAGDLLLSNCENMEIVGKNAEIGGNFDVSHSRRFKQFRGKVGGDADFSGCYKLAKIDPSSGVAGRVRLDGTKLSLADFRKLPLVAAQPMEPLADRLPKGPSYLEALKGVGVATLTPSPLSRRSDHSH
jgi:hypothetical protein